jgi:hypothetical protein
MRTQQSGLGQRTTRQQPASRQYAGHSAGLHPEEDYDLEDDEAYYVTRPHTSARRYDLMPEQVIRQGNRQYTIHHGAPPIPRRQHQYIEDEEQEVEKGTRRRYHPLVWFGIALFIMIIGWIAISALGNVWQQKQDDLTYGQTRTYQTDAVVGHGDSSTSPSHFIALNLRGQIIIIELPGGNAAKARSYTVTTVQGNEGNPPVKLSFQDINADGKLDMIISIGDPGSAFTIMLFNDGTQFVSKLK